MDQKCTVRHSYFRGLERPCHLLGTGFKPRVVTPSPAYYRYITYKGRASLLIMFTMKLTELLNIIYLKQASHQ